MPWYPELAYQAPTRAINTRKLSYNLGHGDDGFPYEGGGGYHCKYVVRVESDGQISELKDKSGCTFQHCPQKNIIWSTEQKITTYSLVVVAVVWGLHMPVSLTLHKVRN